MSFEDGDNFIRLCEDDTGEKWSYFYLEQKIEGEHLWSLPFESFSLIESFYWYKLNKYFF